MCHKDDGNGIIQETILQLHVVTPAGLQTFALLIEQPPDQVFEHTELTSALDIVIAVPFKFLTKF